MSITIITYDLVGKLSESLRTASIGIYIGNIWRAIAPKRSFRTTGELSYPIEMGPSRNRSRIAPRLAGGQAHRTAESTTNDFTSWGEDNARGYVKEEFYRKI